MEFTEPPISIPTFTAQGEGGPRANGDAFINSMHRILFYLGGTFPPHWHLTELLSLTGALSQTFPPFPHENTVFSHSETLCGDAALARPGPFSPRPRRSGGTLSVTDPWRRGGSGVSRTVSLPPPASLPAHPPERPGLSPGKAARGGGAEGEKGGRAGSRPGAPLGPGAPLLLPFPHRGSNGRARRFQACAAGWLCCVWLRSRSIGFIGAKSHVWVGKRVIVASPTSQCERARCIAP